MRRTSPIGDVPGAAPLLHFLLVGSTGQNPHSLYRGKCPFGSYSMQLILFPCPILLTCSLGAFCLRSQCSGPLRYLPTDIKLFNFVSAAVEVGSRILRKDLTSEPGRVSARQLGPWEWQNTEFATRCHHCIAAMLREGAKLGHLKGKKVVLHFMPMVARE
jgi:hypothetical protein